MEATPVTAAAAAPSRCRATVLYLAGAALVTTAVFGAHLDGEYVWDDVFLVERNPVVQEPGQLGRLLRSDLWGPVKGHPTQLYHPLPLLTLRAEARLGAGLAVHRAVNVALHLACGLLLFLLLRREHGRPLLAAGATGLFLIHPAVTEPVMWLTGRHDTLAVLAALGALLVYSPRPARIVAAALLAGAAVLCKEPYVVVPLLLAAFELRRLRARGGRPAPGELVGLAAPFAAVAAVFLLRQRLGISAATDRLHVGLTAHVETFTSIVWHYLAQALSFGNGPTVETFRPLPGAAVAAVALAIMAALAGAAVAWRRGRPAAGAVLLGLVWFLLALSPHVLSLPLLGVWANRYGYFPLAGLVLAGSGIAAALAASLGRRARGAALLAAAALTLALAPLTSGEARAWHDGLTLFGVGAAERPGDGKALFHLAFAVNRARGCAESVPLYQRAIHLDPDEGRAWHNLAGCLVRLGRPADAVQAARRALALQPDETGAEYNLGAALLLSGYRDEGLEHLRRTLEREPGHAAARELLARP